MDIVDRIFMLADKQFAEQKDFAEVLGVTQTMVSAWRKRKSLSYSKRVDQIAKLLNTSADYLWTGAEKEPTTVAGDGLDAKTLERAAKLSALSDEDLELLDAQIDLLLKRRRGQ